MNNDFIYSCERTRELLGPYSDNELEGLPTSQVAAHLERCALCRRELEVIQSQKRVLAGAIKSVAHDTSTLRASIEAATIRRRSFFSSDLKVLGTPAWSLAATLILLIGLGSLLYFYGRFGKAEIGSLYRAAATDHRRRSAAADAPDWIQSDSAITEKASNFLNMNMRLPRSFGTDYSLVRVRLCNLDGKSFLHFVYETPDGRTASLFVCPNADAMPSGQRTLKLDGREVELTRVSDFSVNCMIREDCLLITVASDEAVATALLLNTASA